MKKNKPKLPPGNYSPEEFNRKFDEAFADFGTLEKEKEQPLSNTNKSKTYHISFKPKKTK